MSPEPAALVVGVIASLVTGVLAIHALLGWLRRRGLGVFIAYRVALAAFVVVALLRV